MPRTISRARGGDRFFGLLMRLSWMIIGPVLLLIIASVLYTRAAFTELDAVYASILGAMVAARYVDVVRYRGPGADGEPFELEDLPGWVGKTVIIAAGLWAFVHVAGRVLGQ